MRRFRKREPEFELESLLRSARPRPRRGFVDDLTARVERQPAASWFGRAGLVVALIGLVLIAVASYGGATEAATPPKPPTAAGAQYGPFEAPGKPKPKPAATPGAAPPVAEEEEGAALPFSGLALWVPIAVGLLLVGTGAAMRYSARRRPTR